MSIAPSTVAPTAGTLTPSAKQAAGQGITKGFHYDNTSGPRIGLGNAAAAPLFGSTTEPSLSELLGLITAGGSLNNLLEQGLEKLADSVAQPVKLSPALSLDLSLPRSDKNKIILKSRQLRYVAEAAVTLNQPQLASSIRKGFKQFETDPRTQAWIVPLPPQNDADLDALVKDLTEDGVKGDLAEDTQKAEVIANLSRALDAVKQLAPDSPDEEKAEEAADDTPTLDTNA